MGNAGSCIPQRVSRIRCDGFVGTFQHQPSWPTWPKMGTCSFIHLLIEPSQSVKLLDSNHSPIHSNSWALWAANSGKLEMQFLHYLLKHWAGPFFKPLNNRRKQCSAYCFMWSDSEGTLCFNLNHRVSKGYLI
jgi:hypothetical protein